MKSDSAFKLTVTETAARCAVGETIGARNIQEGAIPVLSCEGACIRGEIARLAANRIGKISGFRRACHGELFAVPDSAMATWVRQARDVVVIDGCPLRCHGRIIEHLVEPERLHQFNALARYRKFTDQFDIDSVPKPEREAAADDVADWVLGQMKHSAAPDSGRESGCAGRTAGASTPTPLAGGGRCG